MTPNELTVAQAELCDAVADKILADYAGVTIGGARFVATTDQLQMRISRALRSALYGEAELRGDPQ